MQLDDDLAKVFCEFVYQETGVAIDHSKKTLLEGRLRPELRRLGQGSFAEYFRYLKKISPSSAERLRFVDVVTTHETSFFRTLSLWEFLTLEVETVASKLQRPLRIWSAACSTGEESYSVAMMCQGIQERYSRFNWDLTASDISPGSVEQARRAEYGPHSVRGMGVFQELFERFVVREGDLYRVDQFLVKKVNFRTHNLFNPSFCEGRDVVFVRNVLMYFTREDQLKVLNNIVNATVNNGMVIVGETESLKGYMPELVYVRPGVYCVKKGE